MPEKVLRDYQSAAIAGTHAALARHESTLIVLPTGTGKTVVVAKIAAAWDRGNVLLLAHRTELLDQAADKFEHELGYRPPVEQATRSTDADCLWSGGAVIVGSVQTLVNERRMEKFRNAPFGIIIIDEAHHATAPSYLKVVRFFRSLFPSLKVLGVTATPNRADNNALGVVFDSVAHEMGMAEAIEAGWLVPVEQESVTVEDVDFSSVRSGGKNEHGEGDLNAQDLETVLVEEAALHALARPILDKCGDRQCLVFTAGVAHAHMLAAVLNRYRNGSAEAVDGGTDRARRREIVAAFGGGRLQFLTNFGVFTEGFDVPSVAVVAMGRPTQSVGLYTQMLGRGTRPLPGVVDGERLDTPELRRAAIAASAKPRVLCLDFVGNSRHKLVSGVDVLGGNYDQEVRELARHRVAAGGGADVMAELKKARAEMLLRREQARRSGVRAEVSYTSERVDPFSFDAAPGAAESAPPTRGGSSDAQIALLVNLGVGHATAARYSRRQASAVIEDLKANRCTAKQRVVLARYGEPTDVNFAEASRIIDAIAANGWRPVREGATP